MGGLLLPRSQHSAFTLLRKRLMASDTETRQVTWSNVMQLRRHAGYRLEGNQYLIEINLREPRQLFNSLDPAPFHEKDLDASAEEYIVERSARIRALHRAEQADDLFTRSTGRRRTPLRFRLP